MPHPFGPARGIRRRAGLAAVALALAAAVLRPAGATASTRRPAPAPQARPIERGLASLYPHHFAGNRTASGARFDPNSDTAAHRTLPLGTVARVTNLANGRSALVTIRDRGPFHRGRIIDITPHTARELRIGRAGTARVSVEPLRHPRRGG